MHRGLESRFFLTKSDRNQSVLTVNRIHNTPNKPAKHGKTFSLDRTWVAPSWPAREIRKSPEAVCLNSRKSLRVPNHGLELTAAVTRTDDGTIQVDLESTSSPADLFGWIDILRLTMG